MEGATVGVDGAEAEYNAAARHGYAGRRVPATSCSHRRRRKSARPPTPNRTVASQGTWVDRLFGDSAARLRVGVAMRIGQARCRHPIPVTTAGFQLAVNRTVAGGNEAAAGYCLDGGCHGREAEAASVARSGQSSVCRGRRRGCPVLEDAVTPRACRMALH